MKMSALLSRSATIVTLKILVYTLFFNAGAGIKIRPSNYLDATEGESKAAICEADANEIQWISPNNEAITFNTNRLIHVEEDSKSKLRLVFTNLTEENSGTYTCKAISYDVGNSISKFELKVSKKYQFIDDPKIYYVSLGHDISLYCKLNNDKLNPIISWSFEGQPILPNRAGSPYMTMDDDEILFVKNATYGVLGNYSCTSVLTDIGNVLQRDMQLKLKTPPIMIPVHAGNTVHVPIITPPYWAHLVCKVTADPPASITWFRYNKKFKAREYEATVEEENNQSILKLPVFNKQVLGPYECEATNSLGNSTITINVGEGELPRAPQVHKREAFENGYRLDIYQQQPIQNLSNFRVLYRKKSDLNVDWHSHDFHMKDSETSPYSINNLESNTEYIFKVGSCTEIDLCTYTEESIFKTIESVTSSANLLIQTLVSQFVILLPAFMLNFYSQRN